MSNIVALVAAILLLVGGTIMLLRARIIQRWALALSVARAWPE